MSASWTPSGPDSTRRRSQRVIVSVPVVISGEGSTGPFSEHTETLVISAHGALVNLAAKIVKGQQVKLKSKTHPEAQTCRVVYSGPTMQGKTQMGLEFITPVTQFWQVAFPPEDWTPPIDDLKAPAKAPKK